MAKIMKKKRRRLKIENVAIALFTFSFIVMLFSSLFIGTMNTSLTIEIQNMNNRISELKADNQKLNIEIQTLQNKDRVYAIAKDAALDQNQNNVISLSGDN